MKFKLSLLYTYLVSCSAMFMRLDKEQFYLEYIYIYIYIEFLKQIQKAVMNLSTHELEIWLLNEMDAMH